MKNSDTTSFPGSLINKIGALSRTKAETQVLPASISSVPIAQDTANNQTTDFYQAGFMAASEVGGDTGAFRISLDKFYSGLMRKAQEKTDNLQEKKDLLNAEAEKITAEIEIHTARITAIEKNDLLSVRKMREDEESALRKLKEHPEEHLERDKDGLKLWAYGIITSFLVAFLFLFYSNVIYSLFFREIRTDKDLINHSIFASDYITGAASQGIVALFAIFLAPAVFLALGLMLENRRDVRKSGPINYKYWGFISLTFIFDILLAFGISKKMYDAEAAISFKRIEVYTLGKAITDNNFWTVIFFGFVVYLVTGKLFSLFLEERNIKLKLQRLIEAKEDKIAALLKKEQSLLDEIEALKRTINDLKLKAASLANPGDRIYYSPHELKEIVTSFGIGWIKWMRNGNKTSEETSVISISLDNFYKEKGIANEN